MVSLKLGCGFKSMASHNCCRLDQVAWRSWPGWSSLFPVARLDNGTLCVFHHKRLKDHLREGHESWSLPENLLLTPSDKRKKAPGSNLQDRRKQVGKNSRRPQRRSLSRNVCDQSFQWCGGQCWAKNYGRVGKSSRWGGCWPWRAFRSSLTDTFHLHFPLYLYERVIFKTTSK